MSDQYLWDRTGEPDPEVVELEKLLTGYGYEAPVKRAWNGRRRLLAAAACVALFAAGGLWLNRMWFQGKTPSEWQIAGQRVVVGQTIDTGSQANTKLEAAAFGEVSLDADSRLQVLSASGGNQRLALQRGTMHAFMWAPPATFLVETPSAKTIDLGCAYTLTVLPDDSGLLRVEMGWVAFQHGATESFIPAGAECHTRPRLGPGLPYFENAPVELREAVARYDASSGREGVSGIVSYARKEDALTLWHLALRTSGRDRRIVVDRFAGLVPGIDVAGLLAGEKTASDRAWDLLGLGGADWWRKWKHSW